MLGSFWAECYDKVFHETCRTMSRYLLYRYLKARNLIWSRSVMKSKLLLDCHWSKRSNYGGWRHGRKSKVSSSWHIISMEIRTHTYSHYSFCDEMSTVHLPLFLRTYSSVLKTESCNFTLKQAITVIAIYKKSVGLQVCIKWKLLHMITAWCVHSKQRGQKNIHI